VLKKRYTIALFIGHIENEFSEEVMLGAAHTAELLDVNLVVFPVRYIETIQHDLTNKKYQYQYNCMFSYAENNSFDAIIVETAVMGRLVTHDTMSSILNKFKGTPVITISEKIDDYPCVSFNSNGIETEIEHLVKCHNRKRIGFVSGPLSNSEAVIRLEEYKKALKKFNIDFDPELVAEGDFTEFCNEPIAELLKINKDNIDAICFSNDCMAIPGYHEINKCGLKIGADITVTGFDDIPASASMNPPLTTIQASYRELGSKALSESINFIKGMEKSDITVNTRLIKRDSCGCCSKTTVAHNTLNELMSNESKDIVLFVNTIHDVIYSYYNNTNYQPNKQVINLLLKFISIFLSQVTNPENCINNDLLIFKFNTLLKLNILDFVTVENFNFLLHTVCEKAIMIATPEEKKDKIFRLFIKLYQDVIVYKQYENLSEKSEIKCNIYDTNLIMNSIIENSENTSKNYLEIMQKFRNLNIQSCYFYIHEAPVISYSRYDWVQPETELLHSYYIGDSFHPFKNKNCKIKARNLFDNDYMPDQRYTFIASPVFFSEENYGLLLCDTNIDDYVFYNSIITPQLSCAIKLRYMLRNQRLIQSQLMDNLNKAQSSNKMLSQISKSDELTGIYNRRGFIESVYSSIKRHSGRRAVIIYADMDNLKKINDMFGHDEGDYAIKKASEILRECVRSNDITARFGGDEFVAYAMIYESNFKDMFIKRLNNICSRINRTNNKPYNITISVGVYEFICSKNSDLNKIMNEADKILYINKKNKNINVIKDPSYTQEKVPR